MLRDGGGPALQADFDAVWADRAQLARALDGLVADGLVDPLPDGRYALPGRRPGRTGTRSCGPGQSGLYALPTAWHVQPRAARQREARASCADPGFGSLG